MLETKFTRDKPNINTIVINQANDQKAILIVVLVKTLEVLLKYKDMNKAPEKKEKGNYILKVLPGYNSETLYYAYLDYLKRVDYMKNMIDIVLKNLIELKKYSQFTLDENRKAVSICTVSNILE